MNAKNSEASSAPARLLIADDHALVREGFRAMLAPEADVELVGEAEDGEEVLELCRQLCPELVLMDVRMPKMDGLEATRAIKAECPRTSVLMVTSHESHEYLLDAVRAGAAGYVLKDATREQLMNAVRRCLSGESPLNQEVAMRLLRRMVEEERLHKEEPLLPEPDESGHRREAPLLPGSLTSREIEVLWHLASGKNNREIAQELHLSLSTVKTHVEHVLAKLGVSDRTQAALKAVQMGVSPGRADG